MNGKPITFVFNKCDILCKNENFTFFEMDSDDTRFLYIIQVYFDIEWSPFLYNLIGFELDGNILTLTAVGNLKKYAMSSTFNTSYAVTENDKAEIYNLRLLLPELFD